MIVLPVCVYMHHMCAFGGQTEASDLLELKSQMVVSHHVSAGDPIHILCKGDKASLSLSPLSSLCLPALDTI